MCYAGYFVQYALYARKSLLLVRQKYGGIIGVIKIFSINFRRTGGAITFLGNLLHDASCTTPEIEGAVKTPQQSVSRLDAHSW